MSIDWFRDLVISISGIMLILLLILVAVLSYSLYRRAKSILDSATTTVKNIQGIFNIGDEVVKPVVQVAAIIQGIRQGANAVNKLFKKQKGEEND